MNARAQVRSCLPTPLLIDDTAAIIAVALILLAATAYLQDGAATAIILTIVVCSGIAAVFMSLHPRVIPAR